MAALPPAVPGIRLVVGGHKELIAKIDLFAANWKAGANPFAWVN